MYMVSLTVSYIRQWQSSPWTGTHSTECSVVMPSHHPNTQYWEYKIPEKLFKLFHRITSGVFDNKTAPSVNYNTEMHALPDVSPLKL